MNMQNVDDNNICLKTDSYKIQHFDMMADDTEYNYAYFECRKGALFPDTPLFGLQYIIQKHFLGKVVTQEKIDEADKIITAHLGPGAFNRKGWEYILNKYDGKLPIKIRAIPEGTVVPVDNVLIDVINTDLNCAWLTNYMETILSQVWYPTTVAAQSRATKKIIKYYLDETACGDMTGKLQFMLHDFGYRGVSSNESAGIGGAAHLINFFGTDTIASMTTALKYYNADLNKLAFSVPATEHSVMTALGETGEETVVQNLLNKYPKGILSVVADSYNIYNFVENFVGTKFKEQILNRDGVFVIRPDSVTPKHNTPQAEMVWIMDMLWQKIGGTVNEKGFKVINPKVRVLYGDGLDLDQIEKIFYALKAFKFSAENVACCGCGGGLLQKVNRDTQRCAFKSAAQCQGGIWYDIFKKPLDASKASKKGFLKLIKIDGKYTTVRRDSGNEPDELVTVFENGELIKFYNFEEIRERAKI
jgi:nicotinamide phosphoribosyltransferase